MCDDVVGIGRVQACAHPLQIACVRLAARLAREVLGKPRIQAVHRVHAVDDKVGAECFDNREIAIDRTLRGRVAELAADEHAHAGRILPLQSAGGGEVRLRVDERHLLPLGKHAVRFVVIVEVLGDAVVRRPQFRRAGEHFGERRPAVRRKCAVCVNIRDHAFSIACGARKSKRRTEIFRPPPPHHISVRLRPRRAPRQRVSVRKICAPSQSTPCASRSSAR